MGWLHLRHGKGAVVVGRGDDQKILKPTLLMALTQPLPKTQSALISRALSAQQNLGRCHDLDAKATTALMLDKVIKGLESVVGSSADLVIRAAARSFCASTPALNRLVLGTYSPDGAIRAGSFATVEVTKAGLYAGSVPFEHLGLG
jgi:hypothetical protein